MIYSHTKVQGQWSVSSEDRVKTDGWTDRQMDGHDCITSLANAIGNKTLSFLTGEFHLMKVVLYEGHEMVIVVSNQ